MHDFIQESNIFSGQSLEDRDSVLRFISDRAAELDVTDDANEVYEAFQYRESLDMTGMLEGFAIPHAKCANIKRAAVIVVKNTHPVAWPSFDDIDCDIFIALLVPDIEAGTTHIKLLSKTAVLLTKDDFRKRIRETDDSAEIARIINEGVGTD